jgi:hypothetical protein
MTRFALYCRVATSDKQHPEASQLARCLAYIEARGGATAEYVDADEADNDSAWGGAR